MHLVRSDEMSIEVQLPAAPRTAATAALPPGFRFHPTDEELILHYLRKRAAAAPCPAPVIAEVDIYKFDPWELPAMAVFGEAEWYFFSPRDRKYPNGVRPNRAAGSGYWKATGTDKPISGAGEMLGVKKALVFYRGRPPKGIKTSWIMHEYRLADATNFFPPPPAAAAANITTKIASSSSSSNTMRLDEWVLCRIYKKTNQQLQHMSSLISMDDDDGGGLAHAHQHQHHHHHHHQHRLHDSEAVSASISDYLVDYSAVPPPLFDNSLPAEAAPPLQLGFTAYDGTNKRQRIEDYYSISSSGGFMSSNDDEMRQQLATTTTTMPPLINIMFEPTSGQQQLLPSHHQDDTSI